MTHECCLGHKDLHMGKELEEITPDLERGSGVETVAHLRENGRIVFMFCAFTGPPRIVRLG